MGRRLGQPLDGVAFVFPGTFNKDSVSCRVKIIQNQISESINKILLEKKRSSYWLVTCPGLSQEQRVCPDTWRLALHRKLLVACGLENQHWLAE